MAKRVYTGLDIGSKTCHLAALDGEGSMLTQSQFSTSEANLIAALEPLSGEAHIHLEASELAGWARGVLQAEERVARVVVSHPKSNAWIAKDPLKGDRVDAFKLADLLRMGRVHEVYYPDDDHRREFKELVRHYDDLTAQQVRLKQKIKSRLRTQGIIVGGKGLYSPEDLQMALERVRSPSVRTIIEQLDRLLRETQETQQQARQAMAQEARRFPEIARFREVPGVGLVCACRFSAYVQNPHRFSSKRKLWRYSRLGVTHRSSDGKLLGYQRLDRSGNGRLKDTSRKAFEGTMKTREDNAFKRCFRRSLERTQDERHARLTTQRKILTVLWTMWKRGDVYRDEMG